jgi:hypothetical protein
MKWQGQARFAALWMSLVTAGACALQDQAREASRLVPISKSKLCVTKGAVEESQGSRLKVTVPEMRAVVAYPTRPTAEARIHYLGPTATDKPLRSGEIRRQFGLKLRAADGCNLIYAMWRIEPKPELVVSVKLNPGQTTNAQCGTHGYHTLKPTRELKAPLLKEGESHTLCAAIDGNKLRVYIDNKLTWEGLLDDAALKLEGPSGVRSDNGRFTFEFFASEPLGGETTPCHAASGDE